MQQEAAADLARGGAQRRVIQDRGVYPAVQGEALRKEAERLQKEFAIERGKLLAARMQQALHFDEMRDDRVMSSREMMHVVVMSARVEDRYEEALVMIKSMLFHWRPAAEKRHTNDGLVLHLIVDANGAAFFYDKLSLLVESLPEHLFAVRYHRYEQVCVAPLGRFLSEFDMPMSVYSCTFIIIR